MPHREVLATVVDMLINLKPPDLRRKIRASLRTHNSFPILDYVLVIQNSLYYNFLTMGIGCNQ